MIDVVVATPGRLLDHLQRGSVDLSQVQIVVLDEADRMLDMGFIHDMTRILQKLPAEPPDIAFFSNGLRRGCQTRGKISP